MLIQEIHMMALQNDRFGGSRLLVGLWCDVFMVLSLCCWYPISISIYMCRHKRTNADDKIHMTAEGVKKKLYGSCRSYDKGKDKLREFKY